MLFPIKANGHLPDVSAHTTHAPVPYHDRKETPAPGDRGDVNLPMPGAAAGPNGASHAKHGKPWPHSTRPRPSTADILASARTLIPDITRARTLLDACERRLAEVPDPGLLAIWRLPQHLYRAMMLLFALITAGAALTLLISTQPLPNAALIATGFAANVMLLAHLAGGWARRLSVGSMKRRVLALCVALLLLAEAAILGHALTLLPSQLSWPPIIILAATVLFATLAATARHHPDPAIGRLLDETATAKQQLRKVQETFETTLTAATQRFEEERAALQTLANAAAHSLYTPERPLAEKGGDLADILDEHPQIVDDDIIRID